MKLFLLRHASAEYGGPDPDRPLSEAGKQVAASLAGFTRSRSYYSFKNIWCSPYLRARQTADPFLRLIADKGAISYRDDLTPMADPRQILAELESIKDSLLLVGHNPHLSHLVRHLLGRAHGHGPLPFKKGALVVFKRDPLSESGFTLSAYLPPAALGFKD